MERIFAEAKDIFETKFGPGEPAFYCRAPGYVNVIGDHTEFHGGMALPAAISQDLVLALRPNDGDTVRLHSVYFGQTAS
ncbi:MAG: galactokinase family protein, partial [Planctomycetota bacterium]|nr:galactokinase family protein [Planctomycetota bacterium]